MTEDYTLVQRTLSGDQEAFRILYNNSYGRIVNIMLRRTGNIEDAKDLAQDTFFQAYKKLHLYKGTARFYTWIYRIAVNVHLQARRRKTIETVSLDRDLDVSAMSTFLGQEDKQQRNTPYRILVEKYIDALAPGYKQVLTLYLIGYTHTEIGTIMNRSTGNSKSQLHKAKEVLRERICVSL